jgi:hypothetical protein
VDAVDRCVAGLDEAERAGTRRLSADAMSTIADAVSDYVSGRSALRS